MKQEINYKKIYFFVFLFCYTLVIWRIVQVPLYDWDQGRNFIHGDGNSDRNVHSTAMFYKDFGIVEGSCLLPVFRYTGDGDTCASATNLGDSYFYTHYPALPDILGATYGYILDTKSDQWIRIFPVLLSVVFFFFIIKFCKHFIEDNSAAFYSTLIILLSNYFIAWADNLHKHLYEELIKWVFIYLLYDYYQKGKPKKNLIWMIVLYIVVSNISFEPILYLAVVSIGFCWIYERKILNWETVALGAASVFGVGIHLYQNYLFFGHSWQAVADDMLGSLSERTMGVDGNLKSDRGKVALTEYLEIPFLWFNRLERVYLIPGWAILVFAVLTMKKYYQENRKFYYACLTIFIATISWSLLMSQHFLVHLFTARHWGIWVALMSGVGIVQYLKIVKADFAGTRWYMKTLHVVFIGYIMVMVLSQQVFDLYLKNGFLYPIFGR